MADQPQPVDGLSAPAQPTAPVQAPAPAAAPAGANPVAVRRYKRLLLSFGILCYIVYALWCFGLMAILPSPTGDFQQLPGVALLSAVIAAGILCIVGLIGFLRIKDAEGVHPQRKLISMAVLLFSLLPGLALSALMPLAVLQQPALPLTVTDPDDLSSLLAPVTVTFSADQALAILKKRNVIPERFRWDVNGDRKVDQETNIPTISAKYDRDGVYTVTAVMVNRDGTTNTASTRFIIRQSAFSVTPAQPVVEQPVVFSIAHLVTKENPIAKVHWFFDEDDKEDEVTEKPEVSATFYTVGKRTVRAVVEMKNNTQIPYQRVIEVVTPPPLAFPAAIVTEPKILISPPEFTALFRIDTKTPVANVQWDFGDGTKAEGTRTVHTFGEKGTFAVSARIRSVSGSIVELSTVARVVDPLNIDLKYETPRGAPAVLNNRVVGEIPLRLDITPVTTAKFVTFTWEAPGATSVGSTEGQLQASYFKEGTYTVTLVGQDLEDHVQRWPITVEVQPQARVIDFDLRQDGGAAPSTVEVDGVRTYIPDDKIIGYLWKFEPRDQPLPGEAYASHTYTVPGSYDIIMTVITQKGQRLSTQKTVVVLPPLLRACFTTSRSTDSIKSGYAVTFYSDCTAGAAKNYEWDFGDGGYSDEEDPTHQFLDACECEVKLKVIDADGRTNTTSKLVIVTPAFPSDNP